MLQYEPELQRIKGNPYIAQRKLKQGALTAVQGSDFRDGLSKNFHLSVFMHETNKCTCFLPPPSFDYFGPRAPGHRARMKCRASVLWVPTPNRDMRHSCGRKEGWFGETSHFSPTQHT